MKVSTSNSGFDSPAIKDADEDSEGNLSSLQLYQMARRQGGTQAWG